MLYITSAHSHLIQVSEDHQIRLNGTHCLATVPFMNSQGQQQLVTMVEGAVHTSVNKIEGRSTRILKAWIM